MDKMISVTETVKRRYLKQGIFFTIIGLLGLGVELTNVQRTIGIVLLLIQICALVLVIVYMKKTERVKKEEFDEMADANMYRAKADARDFGMAMLFAMVIVASLIIMIMNRFSVDFEAMGYTPITILLNALFIYMGTNNIYVGGKFVALEEE